MKFRLQADCVFEAENIDDALYRLAAHLALRIEEGMVFARELPFIGEIKVEPHE